MGGWIHGVGDEARLHVDSTNPLNAMSGCMNRRLKFFFATGLVASSCSLPSRGFPFFLPDETRMVRGETLNPVDYNSLHSFGYFPT